MDDVNKEDNIDNHIVNKDSDVGGLNGNPSQLIDVNN